MSNVIQDMYSRVNRALMGGPEEFVTAGLIVFAVFATLVALKGNRVFKAALLTWMVTP